MTGELAKLMERYCDGDARAFEELYDRVGPRIRGYLLKMTRDASLADDLLQVTFLKVHRSRGAYVRGAAPLPWLYAIAHRTFLDEARRKKRARVRVAREETLPEVAADFRGRAADSADDPPDPQLVERILAAIEELPESQRQAVVLIKVEGKSIAEAAAIAGTTRGAMKLRAHRGYKALRARLAESEQGETP